MNQRISPEQLAAAKAIGTLEYLQRFEPDELTTTYCANGRQMHCKAGKYRTKTHDSLEIDGNQFYWWSRRVGGVSALDYLMKVKEMPFRDAVQLLTGGETFVPSKATTRPEIPPTAPAEKRPFILPERNGNSRRVFAYLSKTRGIDPEIISHCMHQHLVYEDQQHHNCVFVGYGDDGTTPRFASVRSTLTNSKWRMDQPGSDKAYSFRMEAPDSDHVLVFEAPIDAMSFASLMKQQGQDWKSMHYVALSGVSEHGLLHFLEMHQIREVTIALDGDQPGRSAAQMLKQRVQAAYPAIQVRLIWPSAEQGKDWNDVLLFKQQHKEKSRERKGLGSRIAQAKQAAAQRNEALRAPQRGRGKDSPVL